MLGSAALGTEAISGCLELVKSVPQVEKSSSNKLPVLPVSALPKIDAGFNSLGSSVGIGGGGPGGKLGGTSSDSMLACVLGEAGLAAG